jgi:PAS domain S-box-containing protein
MAAATPSSVASSASRVLSPLRLRLLGLVAVASFPAALLIGRLAADERHATASRARESTLRLLDSALVEQQDLLRSGQQLLQSLALLGEVAGPPEACSRTLKLLSSAFTRFVGATRITKDLRMDCSSVPFEPGLADVSNVPSMRQALRTGGAVVGYYRLSRTGAPLATIIEPVRDADGELQFFLAMDVEMSWFARLAGVLPLGRGVTVTMFDADGFVFARVPDEGGRVGQNLPNETFAQMAGRPGGFVEGPGPDGIDKFYAFRLVPAANESPITLAVGIPAGGVYGDADRNLRRNLLVAAVTLILALMMAWIAADLFVIRDVHALLGATSRVAKGDLTARVPTRSGQSELTQLADTFNEMAEGLEARRREFLALGDASPDAIVRISQDLRIDWANDALLKRLGASLDALTGVRITDIPIDASVVPQVISLVRETLASGERREVELHATLDGREGWVDLRVVPERDSAGVVTHVMLIARDVTARKHLEAHLAQAERLDSIGKLAGSISHDFNNLLTAIIGNTEIAMRSLEPDHRARADLTEILDVSRRASSLTRQLLSFARRQPTMPRVIDVQPFIEGAATLLRRLVGESVTLELKLDPTAPRIRFDPTHFEQVLVNLVTNGRDAMPSGGVLTIASSRLTVHSDGKRSPDAPIPGDYLLLRVTDRGVGMSPAIQERIFEPFFTTKRDRDGTGLGLAVTYGLVRQHGGFIEVESVEGAGTTFNLYFPATREAVTAAPTPAPTGPAPTGGETILLVEDQDPVRTTIARLLREHGYSVIEARDGLDVLRRWEAGELPVFQIVITDLLMPHMGGEPLARELRQGYPHVPIILISGFDERGSARGMLERGEANALLEKPFESSPLLRLVRELLDKAVAPAAVS